MALFRFVRRCRKVAEFSDKIIPKIKKFAGRAHDPVGLPLLATPMKRRDVARQLHQAHPPSDPLVEGTSSFARGSIAIAARSARASPLKQDSEIW